MGWGQWRYYGGRRRGAYAPPNRLGRGWGGGASGLVAGRAAADAVLCSRYLHGHNWLARYVDQTFIVTQDREKSTDSVKGAAAQESIDSVQGATAQECTSNDQQPTQSLCQADVPLLL